MTQRITIIVAATLAVVAFAAAYVTLSPSDDATACTADARLDAPEGWTWLRDGENDCAWTLYNADGDTAPDSLYESVGETPPPTAASSSFGIVAALIGIAASVVVVTTAIRIRGGTEDSD